MDSIIQPFVKSSENDVLGDAPKIKLEIELYHAGSELSITSPIRLELRLRREQDGIEKDCIFIWERYEALAGGKFVLFHQKGDIFEQVDVPKESETKAAEKDIIKIDGYNNSLGQLAPGGSELAVLTLTDNYHKELIAGERYKLIFLGEEILMWDWGTKFDHVGKELRSQTIRESELPRLILPACMGVDFTVVEESEPWPGRAEYESKFGFSLANHREAEWRREQRPRYSPPPISPSQRVSGAPVLSVTLEVNESQMTRDGDFVVTSRVTYEKPDDTAEEAKQIISHTFEFLSAYTLYRLRNGKWERCETEDTTATGFIMVDGPDDQIKVSEDKDFVSLRPVESWTTQQTVQQRGWTHIPDDSVVGDKFRYVFKGTTLDWWDWGDGEGTVVELPSYHWARVQKPKNHDRRPELVVSGSNFVEFSIVDG